jgi:mitochondrial fission protein ELM1
MQTRGGIATPDAAAPRTWLVLGEKAGDNAQVLAIAEALGWPCETRRIAMQERWRFGKPRMRATLAHVDTARSDRLEPPWPDLVITSGRRLSSVALWIAEESRATKLVIVGRPRRLARRFDLIVASAQYRIAAAPNVLRLELPLMRVDRAAVEGAAVQWQPRLAPLARPITAVLVGGPTKPVVFDAAGARTLLARAASVADGGTLYVTTSRRTPPALVDAIRASLPPRAVLFAWSPDRSAENPYLGLLGLADRFVVTSDSVSMMVEVARLGRPLAIHVLPPARSWWLSRRDLEAVPARLIERGVAVRLGDPFRAPTAAPPDELALVASRVRALFSQ